MVSEHGFKMCLLLDFMQYIYYCTNFFFPDTYEYMLVLCLHRWLHHVLFKRGILKTFVKFAFLKTKTLAFDYIDCIINFLFLIVFFLIIASKWQLCNYHMVLKKQYMAMMAFCIISINTFYYYFWNSLI
jgi:hypothetical protein